MLTRISFCVGAGTFATFVLFLLMQELIKSEENPFTELALGPIVDFVPVIEDIEVKEKRLPPKPPPEPDEVPPDPPRTPIDPEEATAGIEMRPPAHGPDVTIPDNTGYVDGEYLPMVKVDPAYPRRAITRGIEGYVLLEFTVTRTGAVRDPVVVESAPPGIFERAAQDAALRFKYKPRVVNGTPIDVAGVLNRITFSLRDD